MHIINPPTPKSMDFYDFTSKWILQIVQNCISNMAVWRSFTDAVIFYLNIGNLLWNYPYFFTIVTMQTVPVFALICHHHCHSAKSPS
ncbi:hypothetical protein AMTRI_Chr02g254790 [Amborella trichopoda]